MSTPAVLIAGRYRLIRRVGTGGMGVVSEAWDERLQRPVAVKQLHAQLGLTEAEAELATSRAMREARITARLDHPHAVPVFDVVEHEGRPCLIMAFIPSRPLSAILKERHSLPLPEAARIGAQVASALAAAHAVGIVHRDVKPGNVLIAEDGTARISDFGIAHALDDVTLTSTGLVHGTPAYLAPEVALGRESSSASDVFGLGATLHTMLEGAPPFGTDSNSIALLHKVAAGRFDPPRHSGALTPLLLDMLATDPAQRPSMTQAAQTLAAVANGQPAPDRPTPADPTVPATVVLPVEAAGQQEWPEPAPAAPTVPTTPRPVGPRRRVGPLVALALALVAVAVAVALLVPALRQRQPDAQPTTRSAPDPTSSATVAPTTTGSAAAPSSSDPSSPAPSSPAPTSPDPSSAAPSTLTTSTSASASPAPSTPTSSASRKSDDDDDDDKASAGQLADAVTGYYALLPRDTDRAWALLTSSYQSEGTGGRGSYDRFWRSIDEVAVSEVKGTAPDRARATLRYHFADGRDVRETRSYRLTDDDGVLKISASTVLSSTG